MSDDLRMAVIGLGGMGGNHAQNINENVTGATVSAVVDARPERLDWAKEHLGSSVQTFESAEDFFQAHAADAVVIATPHYSHPTLAIEAFQHQLHVLIEKPAGVFTRNVREMNQAAAGSGKVFSIMFNQRTIGVHEKLKSLIADGELGTMKRCNWISTAWYRPQSYYDSGSWRATWAGEGGGVLLNQCPHQLDLWQWFCGLPTRVRAFCQFGRYHDIEVEDDVTAYVEYENGATGTFIASTGEAPGTNRLEIVGDRGHLILQDGELTFLRTRVSERDFNRDFTGGFGQPEHWTCQIPADSNAANQHRDVLQNFADAIRDGADLIAPGEEGIRSLEISNAMLLSSWTDDWVTLPVDEERFHEELQQRINTSTNP